MVKERLPLEDMTLRQLRKVASELGIYRYSRMRKAQLLATVLEVQGINSVSSGPLPILEIQKEVAAKMAELGQEIDGFLLSTNEGLADLPKI